MATKLTKVWRKTLDYATTGSKMKLGVERAISSSDSFISASMLAKRGVLK